MIVIIIVTKGQIGPGRVRSNCIRKSTGNENELMFTLDSVTLAGVTEKYPAASSPSLNMSDYAVRTIYLLHNQIAYFNLN